MSSLEILAFPLSALLATAFCMVIVLCHGRVRFLAGRKFMMAVTGLTVILVAIEGTWALGLFHKPVFWVVILLLMLSLGLSCLNRKSLSYFLTHCGLFLIIFGGFFGAPDFVAANMKVVAGESTSYAVSQDGLLLPLDFKVTLKEFKTDFYDDGVSPKQYTSTLDIDGKEFRTSVNHPCFHKGYFIYQSDYDRKDGTYSVLRLVRDPWLPFVLAGMLALAAGAIMELRKTWQSKAVLPIVLALAMLFGFISLARINLGTLMPALRSLWFVPHLIIYMVAYSVLALSLILSILALFGRGHSGGEAPSRFEKAGPLAVKLLGTASSLLILGMLCGAFWAKMAWGDYWTWDAKECWAAVTWFLTLIGIHLNYSKKSIILALVILLSFLAMQITWYGVNWLPSAEHSMHTYNRQI